MWNSDPPDHARTPLPARLLLAVGLQDPGGAGDPASRGGPGGDGRAPDRRLHPGPDRPQPGGPLGAAPAHGRRDQVHPQGGLHPRPCAPLLVLAGARAGHGPALRRLRGDPLRLRAGRGGDGDRRPGHRRPVHLRHRLAGRLRHRAGRLRLQLQVPLPGRDPGQRPDDLLRDRHGHVGGPGLPLGRGSQPGRGDRPPEGRGLDGLPAAAGLRHLPGGGLRRGPTACPSICPSRRPSWSRATTPSTAR